MMARVNEIWDDYQLSHWPRCWRRWLNLVLNFGFPQTSSRDFPTGVPATPTGSVARKSAGVNDREVLVGLKRAAVSPMQLKMLKKIVAACVRQFDSLGSLHRTSSARWER